MILTIVLMMAVDFFESPLKVFDLVKIIMFDLSCLRLKASLF